MVAVKKVSDPCPWVEKVVSEGGGQKAYIEGYSIGGKTATSQTLPRGSGKYIASFLFPPFTKELMVVTS